MEPEDHSPNEAIAALERAKSKVKEFNALLGPVPAHSEAERDKFESEFRNAIRSRSWRVSTDETVENRD